jgi:drug/metabolite transporter (DMT)-like permease
VISRRSAVLLVALAQVAVGAAAVFARFALVSGGALAVSAARLTLAELVMLGVAASRGALHPLGRAGEVRLLVAGVLLALHFACWITSLTLASVAISTLLVCSVPIWTELATVIARRRIDRYAASSVAIAIVGVVLVVGTPGGTNHPLGIALALGGALAFAAYLLVVRGTDAATGTLAVATRTYGYAAVVLVIATLLTGQVLPPPGDTQAWGGILAMAFVSQLFGHTAINAGVRVLSATLVSTFTLLEPPIAALLAAWLFNERLPALTAVGAVIILAAIGIALRAPNAPAENEL